MTPRIPPLPFRKVRKLLEAHGFRIVGQRGSHVYFMDAGGRKITVPDHAGKDIARGLLRSILDEAGIDPDDVRR